MNLYMLVSLLYDESGMNPIQVRLVSEGKLCCPTPVSTFATVRANHYGIVIPRSELSECEPNICSCLFDRVLMANVDQQSASGSGAKRETLAAVMKRGRHQRQGAEEGEVSDHIREVTDQVSSLNLGPNPLVGLLYDEAMLQHVCTWDPANPECPDRMSTSYQRCQDYNLVDRCVLLQSRTATEAEILTKHDEDYLELMKKTERMSEEDLKKVSARYDGMYFNPRSFHCAMLAAGSCIEMVDHVVQGKIKCGMALVRPPGHHAAPSSACGYCVFNNAAIAAQHALDQLDLSRVLIVDWDVHHGQATQHMFYDDPRVLYFSIHRYEFGELWPNLRQSDYDAVGEDAGRGYNINIPLNETGLTNDDYLAIVQQVLLPVAYQFSPQLVIVSSGYDAAVGDIEGECVLTPAFYAHLVHMLKPLAGGRISVILEGGYCLRGLAESVALTLRSLLDDPCPLLGPVQPARTSVTDVILHALRVLRPYWSALCFQDDAEDDINLPTVFTDIEIPKKEVKFDEGDREEYDIVGDYPVQTPEQIAQYDLDISRLIKETNLMVPPNRTCVAYDEQMRQHKCHTIPNHPERPDRVSSIYKLFEEEGLVHRCKRLQTRTATTDELKLVHSESYIEEVSSYQTKPEEELAELEQRQMSLYLSQEAFECACLATGCVLNTVDEVMQGQSQNGLAIIRPPGHHAEASRGMGFCFFNSIAVAAKYAIDKFALERVLILDWDVHHGNGTQQAFYDNPNVLFVSLHRYNWGTFFPIGQSGGHDSVGTGEGAGYNVNIPWNAPVGQLGDTEYLAAFQQIVMPIIYEFAPQLVLVSAGFDAAKGDPLVSRSLY
ncbi:Histone deacetylase 6 [Lamellibrachia satsuma]|nr:Histone deacetylase 6 [Lamellibrachia satsuma]